VEIAWRQGGEGVNIVVRDSKFPGQEPLVFTPGEWAVFLERVKTGDFDALARLRSLDRAQDRAPAARGGAAGVA
jgi:hypothetical protein